MSAKKEFLDKIGLKKFWKLIDGRKQDKLEAGSITSDLLDNRCFMTNEEFEEAWNQAKEAQNE